MIIIILITFNLAMVISGFVFTSYAIFVDEVEQEAADDTGNVKKICESHYRDCRCLGILWLSRGERFTCIGFNFCGDIKVTQC